MGTQVNGVIGAGELARIIDNDDVKLLDATYAMTGAPALQERIGDAQYFDIDDIADPDSDLPHMLPDAGLFEAKLRELGIDRDDAVVVYDQTGIAMAASRAWWMFRVFGHDNVAVLDGGLPKWKAEGRPLDTEETAKPEPGDFAATFRSELVRTLEQVDANIHARTEILLDARDSGRFTGATPEIRQGIASGHIPGSLNTPFMELIDHATGTLKSAEELKAIFDRAGVDTTKPLATTCGSGVTACVVALALHRLGRDDVPVYDGSWTEWGVKMAHMAEKNGAKTTSPASAENPDAPSGERSA